MNILRTIFPGMFGAGAAPKAADGKGRAKKSFRSKVEADYSSKLSPEQIKQLKHGDFEEGLVASLTGKDLLLQHSDKIKKLTSGIGLPRDQFQALIYPVIENFADFAHNLPASKAHHHRGYGGLLAHSLDVACFAVNTAILTSFDYGSNPSMRTIRRERWYAAATFAALLHDAGKALNDMEVHDENREHTWTGSKPIFEWAAECGIKTYLVTWVPNRGEKHKIISPSLLERFLPPETRNWIREGGVDIYHAMVDAMACNDPKAILTGIVIKSDSASVDLNLKTGQGLGTGGGDLAVNVPSNFTNAAQFLLEKSVWTANAKGSRIWTTTAGVFIAWKTAVPEVVNFFDSHKIRGCPRGSDSLGSVLIDHGLLEPSEDGSLYWNVSPDILTNEDTGRRLWLKCVKLTTAQTLYPYDAPPEPVAVSIGNDEASVRYDPGAGEFVDGGDAGDAPQPASGTIDFMAPMFSLDAPAVPASTKVPAATPSAPAANKPTLEFLPSTAVEAPALTIGARPVGKTPADAVASTQSKAGGTRKNSGDRKPSGKPNIGKSASELGITLELAPEVAKPAIVIRGLDEPLPSALPIADKKAPAPNPVPAKAQEKNSSQKPPVLEQIEVPKVTVAVHVPEFANDDFGSISGVDASFDSDKPALPDDLEPDPFAGVDTSGAEDPFNTVKPAAKVVQQVQKAQAVPVQAPPAPPVEEVASEVAVKQAVPVPVEAGLEDFDPEIMKMMGLEVPAGNRELAQVPPKAVVRQVAPAPIEPKFEATHEIRVSDNDSIPDAFRFDSVNDHFSVDLDNFPSTNPSDFKSVPDDLRINEVSVSPASLIKEAVPFSQGGLVVASDDALAEFDLPSFVGDVVVGEIPSLLTSPVRERELEVQSDNSAAYELDSAPTDTAKVTVAAPSPAKQQSVLIGASLPASVVIKPSAPDSPGVLNSKAGAESILIGPAMHQARRERKAVADGKPVQKSTDGRVFTPKDTAEFEVFLGRTPALREKLLYHADKERGDIKFAHLRPFVPFCKSKEVGGFVESDIDALSAAGWVWQNFTNPKDPLTGKLRGQKGFYLTDYLGECVSYLSGGIIVLDLAKEFKSAFGHQQLKDLADSIIESSVHYEKTESARIHRFTLTRRIKIASDLGVKLSDVDRALVENTEYLALEKFWKVLVENKETSYE